MRACCARRRASSPAARRERRERRLRSTGELVQLGGLEPPTSWSTAKRSNQLSYSCTRLGSRRNLRAPSCFDKMPTVVARGLPRGARGAGADIGGDKKSPGGEPGPQRNLTNADRETQATFLNTLPKLSLTGSVESAATFCAMAASSLD